MELKGTTRCKPQDAQTQKSPTPTELAAPARADAGSNLNGLARSTPKSWIGWAALVVGIGALAASITLTSTPAGQGVTLGFAASYSLSSHSLSLLARNQTPTHLGAVRGRLRTVLLPWLGEGFAPDPASRMDGMGSRIPRHGPRRDRMAKRRGRPPYTASTRTPAARRGPALSPVASVEQHFVVGLGTVVLGATVAQSLPGRRRCHGRVGWLHGSDRDVVNARAPTHP